MIKPKICVVTGSRADYGLLYPLMKDIGDDPAFEFQIIATGTHLSPEFSLTYKIIEKDGFHIDEKIEMLISSDTAIGVTKSLGLAIIGFGDSLYRLNPDILIVLGDRYEILAAAQAALISRIPIAHISGGDITEGSLDDAFRHSISKMSHLHFVNCEQSAQVVRQLGEDPKRIYNVGSLGIDCMKRVKMVGRSELESLLEFNFRTKNILVTFHPTTINDISPTEQLTELLSAIDILGEEVGVIFTKSNADKDGRTLNAMIDSFSKERSNIKVFTSLGQQAYLSVIVQMDAVVGNSSSGLTEVPYFRKPTVNIGDRQKGRLIASSIINCSPNAKAIENAIRRAFQHDCSMTENPYGDGNSSRKIIDVLKSFSDFKSLLTKAFNKVES